MIIDPNTKYMYMTRGDTVAFKADLEDDEGEPKALVEGDTIYFTVKESARTDEIKVQKIITEFVDGGVALITLHPNDTKSLDFKRYRYDIQFPRMRRERSRQSFLKILKKRCICI